MLGSNKTFTLQIQYCNPSILLYFFYTNGQLLTVHLLMLCWHWRLTFLLKATSNFTWCPAALSSVRLSFICLSAPMSKHLIYAELHMNTYISLHVLSQWNCTHSTELLKFCCPEIYLQVTTYMRTLDILFAILNSMTWCPFSGKCTKKIFSSAAILNFETVTTQSEIHVGYSSQFSTNRQVMQKTCFVQAFNFIYNLPNG